VGDCGMGRVVPCGVLLGLEACRDDDAATEHTRAYRCREPNQRCAGRPWDGQPA